jgi:prepilin-type processing-associated H-X9-DG protein
VSPHDRRGLTLVELLAMIAIIAVLAALLLPAVQMTREAGRRTTCIDHQRELAQATLAFVTAQGRFPGSVNVLGYRARDVDWQTGLPNGTVLAQSRPTPCSWAVPLLPWLERADLTERHATDRPGPETGLPVNTHVDVFLCPSDQWAPSATRFSPQTTNSYAVNCGQIDHEERVGTLQHPVLPDVQANGVFHNHFPFNHRTGRPKHMRVVDQTDSFIQRGDGAATTLLLSENVDSGNWGAAVRIEPELGLLWWPTIERIDGQPRAVPPLSAAGVPIAGINQAAGTIDQVHPEDTATRNLYARPASMHPGGVVATFCDGHVSFLDDETDYLVYCLLMTPDGQHAHDMARNQPADNLFRRTALSQDSLE